ncbi:TolB family protein [Sphaerisporangium aureirubrum]|uniref:TolB family protein n=1 Tax=Sphaerisporangium aureirubrum TaxID=1544736 RepID=A0ABW1N8M3_9ACTN
MTNGPSLRARVAIVVCAAVLLAAAATGYVLRAGSRGPGPVAAAGDAGAGPSWTGDGRVWVLSNGVLSSVAARDPAGPRVISGRRCDRAHAAHGTVACLLPVDALRRTRLDVLSRGPRGRRSVPLTGFPNRLRVSDSGRMVAWTLFVGGHSYAAGGFSTSAGILDTRTGETVRSLEEFAVTLGGRPYRSADVNVWGVTFTRDDNRFYATLSTGGRRYLVEGDFSARTLRTVADGVECPSLSPDGTRVAFKAAAGGDPARGWRLSVLDLATREVVASAEARSVDDQAIWLDDRTLAYGLQRSDGVNDVWTVPADGTGRPRVLVPQANSPALDAEAGPPG